MGGWATWDEGEKRGCGRRNRCRGTESRQHLAARAAGAREDRMARIYSRDTHLSRC